MEPVSDKEEDLVQSEDPVKSGKRSARVLRESDEDFDPQKEELQAEVNDLFEEGEADEPSEDEEKIPVKSERKTTATKKEVKDSPK